MSKPHSAILHVFQYSTHPFPIRIVLRNHTDSTLPNTSQVSPPPHPSSPLSEVIPVTGQILDCHSRFITWLHFIPQFWGCAELYTHLHAHFFPKVDVLQYLQVERGKAQSKYKGNWSRIGGIRVYLSRSQDLSKPTAFSRDHELCCLLKHKLLQVHKAGLFPEFYPNKPVIFSPKGKDGYIYI